MVLALRMKSGSFEIASASASFWLPIAFIITFEVSDQGRDVGGALGEGAGELRGVDDQALEGALVVGELARRGPREVERNGFGYLKPLLACSATPS